MGRRHHGNGLPGDVDVEVQATAVDGREVALHEFSRLVADVQIHAVDAQALDFVVDGPRHDVARRQFAARVEILHEGRAVLQQQMAAFAAYRFADEEGAGLRVV